MQGYVRMPRVEENLASPRPVLLSKPLQTTLRLVGKACLEGLLEDLDQGVGLSPEAVKELCTCRAFRGVIRPSSLTTSELFGTAIETVVKLIEARVQPAALRKFIPRLIWLILLRLSTSTNGHLWGIYFFVKKRRRNLQRRWVDAHYRLNEGQSGAFCRAGWTLLWLAIYSLLPSPVHLDWTDRELMNMPCTLPLVRCSLKLGC